MQQEEAKEEKVKGSPPRYLRELIGNMSNVHTILELGNKTTKRGIPYRDWYIDQGCEYTSIDWNGKDGALPLDLQEPIELGPFDLVTNFGTTEHVEDQKACWENVHRFVKVGGVFVNHTPEPTHMEHHGFWHPTVTWFIEFAQLNGYRVNYTKNTPKHYVHAKLTKIADLPFRFPEEKIHRTALEV